MTTRNALLDYIRADTEPRPRMKIIKFMFKTYSTTPAATRQQLHRLLADGEVEVIDEHWYRVKVGA